jgi:hypothetical protein
MDMIVRGSEYQDFLQCRKKWFHGWVEKITPIRQDNKLWFGTLFHKWLERYYANQCNALMADMETSYWMNEQDMSGMEQTDIDDQIKLFNGVKENYIKTYDDSAWNVLATELEFIVMLEDGIYFTGTIDLVYELYGKIYFIDHKTVASLDMYEEKSKMDRQISRYWWALDMIAKGVGRIKKKGTNGEKDMWVQWHEIAGKEIEGFTYNLIAKDFPREPKVLKPKKGQIFGDLSVDKSQKTTYDKYLAKITELGKNPNDYVEMLNILQNKPDPFLRRVNVLRTQNELESSVWEFLYTVNDIHDVSMALLQNPERVDEITYRHIGTHCDHMCQFKAICQASIAGDNVQLVRNLAYKKNEDR